MKAGSIPYTIVGTPEKDSGTRLPPAEELVALLNNKERVYDKNDNFIGIKGELFQDAINRIERHDFCGVPASIKMVVNKQCSGDMAIRLRVESQKKAIDLAKKKHEGKIV